MTIEKIGSLDIKFNEEQTTVALQKIAEMYSSPYRVIYEYIQNSIDSAHGLRIQNDGFFPYPIEIVVHISSNGGTITIRDNCEGMNKLKLTELVNKIFLSSKKSLPWASGQFGYGVQSFRAFFEKLTFISKTKDHVPLQLNFRKESIKDNGLFINNEGFDKQSGTNVILEGLDKSHRKFKKIDPEVLKEEIELHFENILREKDLSITIEYDIARKHRIQTLKFKCEPFDYSKYEGTEIIEEISINNKKIASLFFKILEGAMPSKRPPKFTTLNMRVNEIYSTPSFIKENKGDTNLWEHPFLVGYVDISKEVILHIDRSDFFPSEEIEFIYSKLKDLMNTRIKSILQNKLEKKSLKSYDTLSSLLEDAFSEIAKDDNIKLIKESRLSNEKSQLLMQSGGQGIGDIGANVDIIENKSNEEDISVSEKNTDTSEGNSNLPKGPLEGEGTEGVKGEKGEKPATEIKKSGIPIKISNLGSDGPMAERIGNTVVINASHSNYIERNKKDEDGNIDISDGRLIHYLAQLVTTFYIQDKYERYGTPKIVNNKLFFDFTDTVCRAEVIFFSNKNAVKKILSGDQ